MSRRKYQYIGLLSVTPGAGSVLLLTLLRLLPSGR
jgi:hypothetical protein